MRKEKVGPSVDGSRDVWGAEASRAADTTKGPERTARTRSVAPRAIVKKQELSGKHVGATQAPGWR